MGWNGSDQAKKAEKTGGGRVGAPHQAHGARHGLLAGLIVVAIGCAGVWWFVGGHGVSRPAKDDRVASAIAAVAPGSGSKAPGTYIPPAKREVVKTGDKVKDALEEVKAEAELVKIEPPKDLAKEVKKSKRVFHTGTEQLMSWLVSVEPGDMPMPIPSIGDEDRANLATILTSKNEVSEDDSELVANLKEGVDYCKKEMMKFIKDGGDPDDFMQYYFQQLNSAFETRNEVQSQYDELHEEDPELAKEFLKKANELLDQKGIKRVIDEDAISETETTVNTEEQK